MKTFHLCFYCTTHPVYHFQIWWHGSLIPWDITLVSLVFIHLFVSFREWKRELRVNISMTLPVSNETLLNYSMLEVPPLIVGAAAGIYKLCESQESSSLLKQRPGQVFSPVRTEEIQQGTKDLHHNIHMKTLSSPVYLPFLFFNCFQWSLMCWGSFWTWTHMKHKQIKLFNCI